MSAGKGPIIPPEMALTIKQLKTVRAINEANADFWKADAEQLEELRHRRTDKDAALLMEMARVILNETGTTNHAGALRAAEAIEALSRQTYAAGRQRQNKRRQQTAEREAITRFCAWEKRNERSVRGLDPAKRVKTYCELADVSDRESRRIRRLLKAGKIFPCTGVNARD